MKNLLLLFLFVFTALQATGAWMMSGRTHPELKWRTLETENFDVHYHEGIRDIAIQGASMAEQMRPMLMKQMGIETIPRLDITFTAEDEILNGFAMPSNHTVIWVDQNDAALWEGDEKWLRSVLAHELQHLVFFNTVKTWLPVPMSNLIAGVPGWVVEGMAEYYTERWRPFRFDISHKGHVIRNTIHKIRDPHNDGFSKSLYLAERFGDSTITKILNHRNKAGLLDFKTSFKKHTGIKLKQFNEDWRRQMNTFFYGQRAQKERIEDIGRVHKLPLKRVANFDYFPDSLRIAMIGLLSKGQRDLSLVVATRDTAKERKKWEKRVKKAEKKEELPKKVKPIWKLKELDYGIFGEMIMNIDVSPNGESIVYTKYHYGEKQSLVFDIWKFDVGSKKKTLLTSSMRSNYPVFSPDSKKILFIAHQNSTTQLYIMDQDGDNIKQITENTGDVQILTPVWSPDGKSVAYAQSDSDGFLDIHIMDLGSSKTKQITNSAEGDLWPIWHPDGEKISYTGLYDYTPNLYTHDLTSGETVQNTDVGDIVIGAQWNDKTSTIIAFTLNTVDSSRVVEIDPSRVVIKTPVVMNPAFSSWRTKTPDNPLENIVPSKDVTVQGDTPYNFYKNMAHLGTFILPDVESFFYESVFTDGLGRHIFGAAYATDYDSIHATMLQYINNTGFPFGGFWGVNYYNDFYFQLQFYNRDYMPLVETFDGISIWGELPYNFGRSLTTNHSFGYALFLMERTPYFPEGSLDIFKEPKGGREGRISLSYTFKNKRNHLRNLFAPNQGYGFKVQSDITDKSIWGDFDYTKTELDFYTNQKLWPLSLYARGRFELMSGTPPPQDSLGLVDIPNFYLAGSYTPGREYMSPRGWSGARSGDRAIMGTLELRFPAVPFNVIEILKIFKLGQPTFALISDFGNAWKQGQAKDDMVITTGAEFRFSFSLGNFSMLIFNYGWAQSPEAWKNDFNKLSENTNLKKIKAGPRPYFRLTLINPF